MIQIYISTHYFQYLLYPLLNYDISPWLVFEKGLGIPATVFLAVFTGVLNTCGVQVFCLCPLIAIWPQSFLMGLNSGNSNCEQMTSVLFSSEYTHKKSQHSDMWQFPVALCLQNFLPRLISGILHQTNCTTQVKITKPRYTVYLFAFYFLLLTYKDQLYYHIDLFWVLPVIPWWNPAILSLNAIVSTLIPHLHVFMNKLHFAVM